MVLILASACTADRIGGTAGYLFLDPDHRVWCQTYDEAHPDVTYDDWPSYNCDLNAALKAQLPVVTLHLPEPQLLAAWDTAASLSNALPSFDTWTTQLVARGGHVQLCQAGQIVEHSGPRDEIFLETYDAISGYDLILVTAPESGTTDTPETIIRLRLTHTDTTPSDPASLCK